MAFVEAFVDFFPTRHESARIFALCAAIFFVPLLVSQQLITGTLVNAMLIYSALRVRGSWSYVPAVIPSIAAMLAGILFGTTHAVLAMLPAIWAGNMALIFIMKRMVEIKDYATLLAGSAIAKTVIISASYLSLVYLIDLPNNFLQVFTYMQLITVILGGILAFLWNRYA